MDDTRLTTELEEYIRQLKLRQEVLIRNIEITVMRRTLEFAQDAVKAIGEISVDECKEAIKRMFCEEMDKLR